MKLLFINPVGFIGGAERVLLQNLAALRRLDPNLELILIVGSSGALIEAARSIGVSVICLPIPDSLSQLGDSHLKGQPIALIKILFQLATAAVDLLGYLQQLQRKLIAIQPDLIHSNGIKTHGLIGLLGRLQCPIVWHVHDFYSARPLMAKVLRRMAPSIAGAIAPSQAVAIGAKSVISLRSIEVIHPAVDSSYFSSRLFQTGAILQIGLVATFARWKGHDVFLQAAAQVKQVVGDAVRFCIVGDPIYQTAGSQVSLAELQAKVRELELEPIVEFLGFQSDMKTVYQSLDIVVHASTQPEPFGLVIAEAMACGKAVIVSQAGGAAELFTPDYDAIGVPPGDPTALAQALIELIRGGDRRLELGRNAQQTAIKRFSCDRLGADLITAYARFGCSIDTKAETYRNASV